MVAVLTNPKGSVELDPTKAGLPVPVRVAVENGREHITATFFARGDPALDVRVVTPSTNKPSLRAYLDDYLPAVAEDQGVEDVQAFIDDFNDEYKEFLNDSAGLNVEAHPSTMELNAGESKEVVVYLYPSQAGQAMIAVAAIDSETEELVSLSELIGLTVGADEFIYRSF